MITPINMDEDNSIMLPNDESSMSPENTNVFDFKNLRNCLPTVNNQPSSIPLCFKWCERSEQNLMNRSTLSLEKKFQTEMKTLRKSFFNRTKHHLSQPSTSFVPEGIVILKQQEYLEQHPRDCGQRLLNLEADRLNKLCAHNLLLNEERSRSHENANVFDLKNLKSCLPTTNHQSGRMSLESQNIEKAVERLMVIKGLLYWKRKLSRYNSIKTLPERTSNCQKSGYLGPSTSHGTEENTVNSTNGELSAEEDFEQKLSECREVILETRKNNKLNSILSSIMVSKIGIPTPQERRRSEFHRYIYQTRQNDRLKKLGVSRNLSASDLDETERLSCLQSKLNFFREVMSDIIKEKKKVTEEMQETSKLIQMLKIQETEKKMP